LLLKTNFGDDEDERCASRSAHWLVITTPGRRGDHNTRTSAGGIVFAGADRLISGVVAVSAARSDQP